LRVAPRGFTRHPWAPCKAQAAEVGRIKIKEMTGDGGDWPKLVI
jgi:hypothetical protein